jgi:hypothetical protein
MTSIDVLCQMLDMNHDMLKRTLADFSDADMLVRPAPAANHACWQLGHLCASECRMISAVKGDGSTNVLPAGFAEKFNKETARVDDAAKFVARAELLETFARVRANTTAIARSIDERDWLKEIPSPFRAGQQTTISFMLHMPALHTTMHIGQFQVIRRVLGKPLLF